MNYIYNLSKKADTGTEDTNNYLFAFEKLNSVVEKRIFSYSIANQYGITKYLYINDSLTIYFPYIIVIKNLNPIKINYNEIFIGMTLKQEFINPYNRL